MPKLKPAESKNLFHYELKGEPNEELKAQLEKNDPIPHLTLDGEWNPAGYRTLVTDLMNSEYENDPTFKESVLLCDREETIVPIRDGNDSTVRLWIYRPHSLKNETCAPAIVYVHGGGSVGGRLEDFIPHCSRMAVRTGTVVCAVGYRMVPDFKFPATMMDSYVSVKHVIENAVPLGIDPNRIAISGDSAGGYQILATAAKLAQENESHLIKVARVSVAQIFDYFFTEPKENMTLSESQAIQESDIIMTWMVGEDRERHLKERNPLLFPGLASDELLANYPPFIIVEEEFDNYVTPNARLAERLKKAGRLLEYFCYPGTSHYGGHPNSDEDFVRMFEEYLK